MARRTDEEVDDTVRLILMEFYSADMKAGNPYRTFGPIDFKHRLEEELDETVSALELARYWKKYVGFDGREKPTHNFVTGEAIR